MLTKPARARGTVVRDAVLGSWARTGLAAAIIVLILGGVLALAATGKLGDLRYLNIPLVHPWPPTGYYQNPFNPTDRGDIVNASEAAKVKNDLVADGQVELQADRAADGSLLAGADTGNSGAGLAITGCGRSSFNPDTVSLRPFPRRLAKRSSSRCMADLFVQ